MHGSTDKSNLTPASSNACSGLTYLSKLRCCCFACVCYPRLSYLARVVPPGTLAPHAKEFDNTVIRTASEKLGLPLSLDNVALLPLSLPIRLGGLGSGLFAWPHQGNIKIEETKISPIN